MRTKQPNMRMSSRGNNLAVAFGPLGAQQSS